MDAAGLIGLGISTVLVVGGLWLGFLQIAKPSLDYEITYSRPVLGERERLGGSLSVLVDGNEPPDPWVFAVRFTNLGWRPIKSEDFESPLRLQFGDAYLMNLFLARSHPEHLKAELETEDVEEQVVLVQPLLLNRGDWLELQAITNGEVSAFSVQGRVANVSRFRDAMAVRGQRVGTVAILASVSLVLVTIWTLELLKALEIVFDTAVVWPLVVLVSSQTFVLGLLKVREAKKRPSTT